MQHAACAEADDPEAWFPSEQGHHGVPAAIAATCARCPVASRCLDYAVEHKVQHGIWGGVRFAVGSHPLGDYPTYTSARG